MIPHVLLLVLLAGASSQAAEPSQSSPWSEQREFDRFAGLLRRSPFSLPTAEESSPLAERYTLTGAIAINGENEIFVLDKTTQQRLRVGTQPNPSGLQLVEFLPDADARKMRATIRLEGQTATISYAAVAAPASAAAASKKDGAPENKPSTAQASPAPKVDTAKRPNRLVIRRTGISGNPTPAK